ncbi:MAG: type II toxin-antitoxin system RelE/ParE family toxin [Clostridiales bacterium]
MIKSFGDKNTEKIFNREKINKIPEDLQRLALRKMTLLNAVVRLGDLKVPPGNHLEKLKGDRKGQYSIRVNDQYRICFKWQDSNCFDVEMVDYH